MSTSGLKLDPVQVLAALTAAAPGVIASLIDSTVPRFDAVTGKIKATDIAPVGAVNLKNYGAVGDGVTDDYAALNNAMIAASTFKLAIEVPPGTYYIGTSIELRSDTFIFSNGGATFAIPANGTLFYFSSKTNLRVEGLNFTAPDASAVAVHARGGSSGITILRNTCTNARLLITNPGPTYTSIDTSGISGAPGTVTNVLIDGNVGTHPAGDSVRGTRAFIELRYVQGVRVQGNDITGFYHGIMWWGGNAATDSALGANPRKASDITIVNNSTRANFGGIWGSMARNVVVAGNNVRDSADVGIDFEGCFDCTAAGNTVRNSTYACYAVFFGCKRITFTGNTALVDAGVGSGAPSFSEGGVVQTGIGTGFKSHTKSNPNAYIRVVGNSFTCPAECAYGDIESLVDSAIESNTMVVTGANQRSVLFYDCNRVSVSHNRIHHEQDAALSIDLWGGYDYEIIGNYLRCASDATASVTAATGAIRVSYRNSTFRAQRARIVRNKTLGFATGITDVNSDTTAGRRESYALIDGNSVPTIAHYQTTNYKGVLARNVLPTDPTVTTPETILV